MRAPAPLPALLVRAPLALGLSLLLGVVAGPPAGAGEPKGATDPLAPARPAEPAPEFVWVDLARPSEGARREGRIAWVEVAGQAGAGTERRHDVVVLIDVSGSTAFASGADVDGDGRVGRARRRLDPHRSFNPRHLSSDLDDTILEAEIVATRRLLERLGPARTRVALVTFADTAVLEAPLGSDGRVLEEALGRLGGRFGSGATNLADAIDLARRALLAADGEDRTRSILVLSDGHPTAPGHPELAVEEAFERAVEAGAAGIRIFSFALGLEEIAEDDVFAEIAHHTGGRFTELATPGEIIHELPRIDLSEVARVEVENATLGAHGRGTRVFPDGSFDAFLKLAEGENVVRVTAHGRRTGLRRVERRVFFLPREPRDAAEARAFEAEAERLRRALALRSIETELAARAQAGGDPEAGRTLHLDVVEE